MSAHSFTRHCPTSVSQTQGPAQPLRDRMEQSSLPTGMGSCPSSPEGGSRHGTAVFATYRQRSRGQVLSCEKALQGVSVPRRLQ